MEHWQGAWSGCMMGGRDAAHAARAWHHSAGDRPGLIGGLMAAIRLFGGGRKWSAAKRTFLARCPIRRRRSRPPRLLHLLPLTPLMPGGGGWWTGRWSRCAGFGAAFCTRSARWKFCWAASGCWQRWSSPCCWPACLTTCPGWRAMSRRSAWRFCWRRSASGWRWAAARRWSGRSTRCGGARPARAPRWASSPRLRPARRCSTPARSSTGASPRWWRAAFCSPIWSCRASCSMSCGGSPTGATRSNGGAGGPASSCSPAYRRASRPRC